jgi:excisionase family DNA binding protein
MTKKYVSLSEAAETFGVSHSTIRNWLRDGLIPNNTYIKVGKVYRFELARLEAALLDRKKEGTAQDDEPVDPRSYYRGKD